MFINTGLVGLITKALEAATAPVEDMTEDGICEVCGDDKHHEDNADFCGNEECARFKARLALESLRQALQRRYGDPSL